MSNAPLQVRSFNETLALYRATGLACSYGCHREELAEPNHNRFLSVLRSLPQLQPKSLLLPANAHVLFFGPSWLKQVASSLICASAQRSQIARVRVPHLPVAPAHYEPETCQPAKTVASTKNVGTPSNTSAPCSDSVTGGQMAGRLTGLLRKKNKATACFHEYRISN